MTMVKFASLCDVQGLDVICRKRSEEYEEWPRCRVCGGHVCPVHTREGSLVEDDSDRDTDYGPVATMTQSVVCTNCNPEDDDA